MQEKLERKVSNVKVKVHKEMPVFSFNFRMYFFQSQRRISMLKDQLEESEIEWENVKRK